MKIFGLLNLVLLIWVLSQIWRETSQTQTNKILWTLGVVFFPFLGSLLWLIMGRSNSNTQPE